MVAPILLKVDREIAVRAAGGTEWNMDVQEQGRGGSHQPGNLNRVRLGLKIIPEIFSAGWVLDGKIVWKSVCNCKCAVDCHELVHRE
jgi:hypothetical protein